MSREPKQAVPAFIDLAAQRERLGDSVERAISAVLNHGQFVLGPEVAELEDRLAAFCGARHCVSCANGTDALLLALRAEGIGPGDAVFVPSFTFAATAEPVALLGATPYFVDVRPDTFTMDLASLAAAVGAAAPILVRRRRAQLALAGAPVAPADVIPAPGGGLTPGDPVEAA